MLKKTAFALAMLPVLSTGTAQASSAVDPAIVAADRALSFYVGGVDQNYREFDGSGVLDKELGTIPRIGVEYSLMGLSTPLRVYVNASYADGDTSYKGQLQNGTPYDTRTGNEMLAFDAGVGYAFGVGRFAFIPGLEYGVSSWVRDIGKGDPQHGVKESYVHGHVALTLAGQLAVTPRVVATLAAAYGKTVSPWMKIVGMYGSSVNSPTYTLGSKPWNRLALNLDYAVRPHLHVGARLAYTRFKYGASAVYPFAGGSYEPDSETKHATFDLAVAYGF